MNFFTEWLNRHPGIARLGALPRPVLLGLGAAMIAVLAVAILWLRQPEYRVLFSDIDGRDGGAIITILDQRNIPHRFANNGTTILVPADQVYGLRLQLAEQGLPHGGTTGFELLDQPQFGASQFTEQITYQRALEGELARSVEALQPVKTARVHLAIPRQSLFVRDKEAPTASVLVTLYPGRSLSEAQVGAIAKLVASSIPKMNADAVSIVDQDGHLLSNPGGEAGADGTRRQFVANIEQRTVQRILTLLNPLVGGGNVRAQANAVIDFSQREQTSEAYRPNETPGTAAIRSKQTAHSAQQGVLPPQGVPGALSNEAPPNASTGTPPQASGKNQTPEDDGSEPTTPRSMRDDATINYEVDRTIEHVKQAPGRLQRLSVAVVINYRNVDGERQPLEPAEMRDIRSLVEQAMGYSTERGDTLSVVNSAFSNPPPNPPLWENPRYQALAWQVGKVLLVMLALLFLWRTIIKPIIDSFATAQLERARHERRRQDGGEQGRQDALRAAERSRYEENLDTARNLAQRDPRAVAMVLRSWMDTKNAKS